MIKKFQSYSLKVNFDLLSILCITNVIITKSLSWEEVIKDLTAKIHRGVLGSYVRPFFWTLCVYKILNIITYNLFLF